MIPLSATVKTVQMVLVNLVNIFFLDTCPYKAAAMLCDKHLGKLSLETAQMLSTAVHLLLPWHTDGLYKATHASHPSSVWARSSLANAVWLSGYVDGMDREWRLRRSHGNSHASYKTSRLALDLLFSHSVLPDADGELTDVPLCMPEAHWPTHGRKFVPLPEAVDAYRKYYRADKAYMATWPKSRVPSWWHL